MTRYMAAVNDLCTCTCTWCTSDHSKQFMAMRPKFPRTIRIVGQEVQNENCNIIAHARLQADAVLQASLKKMGYFENVSTCATPISTAEDICQHFGAVLYCLTSCSVLSIGRLPELAQVLYQDVLQQPQFHTCAEIEILKEKQEISLQDNAAVKFQNVRINTMLSKMLSPE